MIWIFLFSTLFMIQLKCIYDIDARAINVLSRSAFWASFQTNFLFLIGIRYGRQLNIVSFFVFDYSIALRLIRQIMRSKKKNYLEKKMLYKKENKFDVIKIKNSDRKVIKFLISSHRPIKFRRFFIPAEGFFSWFFFLSSK